MARKTYRPEEIIAKLRGANTGASRAMIVAQAVALGKGSAAARG